MALVCRRFSCSFLPPPPSRALSVLLAASSKTYNRVMDLRLVYSHYPLSVQDENGAIGLSLPFTITPAFGTATDGCLSEASSSSVGAAVATTAALSAAASFSWCCIIQNPGMFVYPDGHGPATNEDDFVCELHWYSVCRQWTVAVTCHLKCVEEYKERAQSLAAGSVGEGSNELQAHPDYLMVQTHQTASNNAELGRIKATNRLIRKKKISPACGQSTCVVANERSGKTAV
ncbi:hypothetical protein BGW80DRAFT_1505651 [Lactifluus volemus]|nr:hypothetical protein BGW80DRAFT_1505651 [Lactifluus volemus]